MKSMTSRFRLVKIRRRCEGGKLEEFAGEGDGGEVGEGKRLSEVAGGELGTEMSMEGMAVRRQLGDGGVARKHQQRGTTAVAVTVAAARWRAAAAAAATETSSWSGQGVVAVVVVATSRMRAAVAVATAVGLLPHHSVSSHSRGR